MEISTLLFEYQLYYSKINFIVENKSTIFLGKINFKVESITFNVGKTNFSFGEVEVEYCFKPLCISVMACRDG